STPSDGSSRAFWVSAPDHPPAGSTNTYACPWCSVDLTLRAGAPATMTFPETATDKPKKSSSSPNDTVNSALSWSEPAQPEGGLENTYAAPVLPLWPLAPTTTVAPETATEMPKSSLAAPSLAVSSAAGALVLAHPPG